jgi:hypothetical protein
MGWPSRAGARVGPSPLCKRAPPPPERAPRHAARASPLRLSGPVGPARIPSLPLLDHRGGGRLRSALQERAAAAGALPGSRPVPRRSASRAPWVGSPVSLSSTTVAVAVFAPLCKRAPPPPGLYPARGPCLAAPPLGPRGPGSDPRSPSPRPPWRRSSSLRSASARRRRRGSTRPAARAPAASLPGPCGPGSDPRSFPSTSTSLFARAARLGPPLRRRRSAVTTSCDHLRGGCVICPRSPPPPGGGGRVDVLPQQAPCWPGADGDGVELGPMLSLPRMCSPCTSRCHPGWDKQVSSDNATPPTHCVIVSRDRGSPDRVESNCIYTKNITTIVRKTKQKNRKR